jgi:hypothetical protein
VTDPTAAVLAVLLYLQVKHFLCDYPLQNHYQLQNKGTYGHPGGIIHSGLHAIFTIPIFLIIPTTFLIGAAIIVGEFIIHYNVDWTKQQLMERMGWKSMDREFWWGIGADQFVHHVTYIGIAAVLWMVAYPAVPTP